MNFYKYKPEFWLNHFHSRLSGLESQEVQERLSTHGYNVLPTQKAPVFILVFVRQFKNPLIYILLAAAALALGLGDITDAFFIFSILLINAIIGSVQEYNAEKNAFALNKLVAAKSIVLRGSESYEIDVEQLVPGDIVLVESGNKVPADIRLLNSKNLEADESLLTGESLPVLKEAESSFETEQPLGDRNNMLFKGSLITKGRGKGIVVSTGLHTEIGKIAGTLIQGQNIKPPLLLRMEVFTKKISITLLIITALMAAFLLFKGEPLVEVLIFSVAISVAAIPEGLPIALTVALAVTSRRMSKRNVIVRKLAAVEALGSCTYIATDKTGTLTVNQLTVKKIYIPKYESIIDVEGSGINPQGKIISDVQVSQALNLLTRTGSLCNESHLIHKNGEWIGQGDAVDIAFKTLSYKDNTFKQSMSFKLMDQVPFEPANLYAATLHSGTEDHYVLSVKGAVEKVIDMCTTMSTVSGEQAIDKNIIFLQASKLAEDGYRVLALAYKKQHNKTIDAVKDLCFLGVVGMIDPLRVDASVAIKQCHDSGIKVAMVTGDHPETALSIAKQLGLAVDVQQVVTGSMLKQASVQEQKNLIKEAYVFARVEPNQKLEIVQQLIEVGSFVAVTGDGANDAPALKAAHVGVAMGKSGTDIAKESSDLIIADDKFSSIVAGVEEGRIAYNNIRKVVYLLISTGAAEVLLFVLALLFNTPMPLTAVQILWLNLVTNGIQDLGLAFEPSEGDELKQRPRDPKEPIFNRLMLERIFLSALVMGGVSFSYFNYLINLGVDEFTARSLTLMLMVLFENVMVGCCRSETKLSLTLNPFNNKVLLFGTVLAQAIHIVVAYIPGISDVLGVEPISLVQWVQLLFMALSLFVVMELYTVYKMNIFKFFKKVTKFKHN